MITIKDEKENKEINLDCFGQGTKSEIASKAAEELNIPVAFYEDGFFICYPHREPERRNFQINPVRYWLV